MKNILDPNFGAESTAADYSSSSMDVRYLRWEIVREMMARDVANKGVAVTLVDAQTVFDWVTAKK